MHVVRLNETNSPTNFNTEAHKRKHQKCPETCPNRIAGTMCASGAAKKVKQAEASVVN
jgi:hypothetical protein